MKLTPKKGLPSQPVIWFTASQLEPCIRKTVLKAYYRHNESDEVEIHTLFGSVFGEACTALLENYDPSLSREELLFKCANTIIPCELQITQKLATVGKNVFTFYKGLHRFLDIWEVQYAAGWRLHSAEIKNFLKLIHPHDPSQFVIAGGAYDFQLVHTSGIRKIVDLKTTGSDYERVWMSKPQISEYIAISNLLESDVVWDLPEYWVIYLIDNQEPYAGVYELSEHMLKNIHPDYFMSAVEAALQVGTNSLYDISGIPVNYSSCIGARSNCKYYGLCSGEYDLWCGDLRSSYNDIDVFSLPECEYDAMSESLRQLNIKQAHGASAVTEAVTSTPQFMAVLESMGLSDEPASEPEQPTKPRTALQALQEDKAKSSQPSKPKVTMPDPTASALADILGSMGL